MFVDEKSQLIKNNKKSKAKAVCEYSFIFAVIALVIFGFTFIKNGRSLVLATDGLSQHTPIVAYYGEYLRTILRNIFVNHSFEIPMFDFSIGLGSDIVSTLHYYGFGDPLNLLYVFVPVKYTEYMYGVLCVLRMYLCGLGFSFYMLNRGQNVQATVTGAIAYAFSGFAIMCSVAHPFFISGLMYCPLIFLGIDLILSKKSPILYIVSIALLISTNFYFAYMTCIIMLFYAALRFFEVNKGIWKKILAPTIGKFALYTINAFLIPMVIFLPQINNVLSTGRVNADNYVGVFYSPSYYATLLDSVTNPASNISYSLLGFTGVSLLCIIVCFVRFCKHKNTAIGFLISTVAILFPVFGHIMNGFAYVTNRWSWIFSFIAAVAVSNCYDELFELKNKEKKILWFICTAYLIVLCLDIKARSEVTLLMVIVMFAILCLASVSDSVGISKRIGKQIVSAMLVLCISMQFMYLYDYREDNRTANAIEEGEVYNIMYGDTSASLVNSVENNGEFYRYDDYSNSITENAAILGDVNSASFYYSIANEYVSEFMQELGLNYTLEQRWLNLDDRYILQTALGCKYTTRKPNLEKTMFYDSTDYSFVRNSKLTLDGSSIAYYKGYSSHEANSKFGVSLTEIKNYLPMGYTYDSVISREEYEKLSSVNKQNILLQTAVTDDIDDLPSANVRTDDVAEYNIFELIKENGIITDGIVVKDNTVYVMSTSASITVEVPVKLFSESYMYVNNLDYEDVTSYYAVRNNIEDELKKQQEFNDENGLDREATLDRITELKLEDNEYNYEAAKSISIIANSTYLGKNSLTYYTPMHNFYSGVDTYMVNLGTTPDDVTEISTKDTIKLTFSHVGTYTMDDWTICYQGLDNVSSDYKARTQDVLENVVISDSENKVSGTISLDETKILATQIPYSEGWSVKVDGKEAEVLNINTMFCGVLLDAGEHTVQFSYVTPYANLAVILTVTGTIMLVATGVYYSLKKKKEFEKVSL